MNRIPGNIVAVCALNKNVPVIHNNAIDGSISVTERESLASPTTSISLCCITSLRSQGAIGVLQLYSHVYNSRLGHNLKHLPPVLSSTVKNATSVLLGCCNLRYALKGRHKRQRTCRQQYQLENFRESGFGYNALCWNRL